MVLGSLFPVFFMLVLGGLLYRWRLTDREFLATSDRLIYYIFFPAMLFWKIGGSGGEAVAHAGLIKAAILAVAIVVLISTLYIRVAAVSDFKAGSFSQSCYRFNTYIAVAVILNATGDTGVRLFGILIGILIPLINVVAVSILIWFSGGAYAPAERIRLTLRSLVANPLIIGCLAGLLYSWGGLGFPPFLDNAFSLMSMATLPMALLSIGGSLTLRSIAGNMKETLAASLFKLLLLPVVGYLLLRWFDVTGIAFKVGMLFFAMPTSTALYVLSSQLNSDTELASSSIAMSTTLSFLSLTVVLRLFF